MQALHTGQQIKLPGIVHRRSKNMHICHRLLLITHSMLHAFMSEKCTYTKERFYTTLSLKGMTKIPPTLTNDFMYSSYSAGHAAPQ